MHQLLAKQIERSTSELGTVELSRLYEYVNSAYDEMDRERRRLDRAHSLMAEEHDELNRDLERVVDQLSLQNMRFELALDNMTQGLCMINAAQEVTVANRRFLEIFEIVRDELDYGMNLSELLSFSRLFQETSDHNGMALISKIIDSCLEDCRGEIQHGFASGQTISIARLPMKDGGSVLTIEDITQRVTSERRIRHLAHHDALTDLPNRVLFQNRLSEALKRCRKNSKSLALLYLDLDHFKDVNDTLGHDVGDELLKLVTKRIQKILFKGDLFARLGGDEFAIIHECVTTIENIALLADEIISFTSRPYKIEGNDITIGVSIGIALVRGDESRDHDSSELQKKADLALYDAKKAGRGEYHFFKKEMDLELKRRKVLERDLRLAVSQHKFDVHYQPIVKAATGRIAGFEALARWWHPVHGMVAPNDFIPVAEDIGEIEAIGDFVLRRACKALTKYDGLTISVNVSPLQFRNKKLPWIVKRHLEESGLAPERLAIEINEKSLIYDNASVLETLAQLKAMGISIVMDDFGTGYSSLGYLRQFPFDKIKIDHDFTQDIVNSKNDQAIIDAVIYLGKQFGMTVVAEGIENSEQATLLSEVGCDEMQGFLYSKPVPEASIEYLLKQQKLNSAFNRQSVVVRQLSKPLPVIRANAG